MATPEALEVVESVPQVAPEHPALDKAHVTPLFCVSFDTVAVNAFVPIFACTFAVDGVTLTETPAVIVIVAVPSFDPSATEVAVRFTLAGLGALAGAV